MILDADLQNPPEVLTPLLEKWREGYKVVYTIRRQRKEEWAKRFASAFYYRLVARIAQFSVPLDSGDFCFIDRSVADVLRSMPERNLYLRGLRTWVGFRQVGVEYERDRRMAGKQKYTFLFRAPAGPERAHRFMNSPDVGTSGRELGG